MQLVVTRLRFNQIAAVRIPSGRLEVNIRWYDAGPNHLPQRDQKFACQGDNQYLADTTFDSPSRALNVPTTEHIVRIEVQPAPGQLDEAPAQARTAVLADPLLAL